MRKGRGEVFEWEGSEGEAEEDCPGLPNTFPDWVATGHLLLHWVLVTFLSSRPPTQHPCTRSEESE